MITICVSCCFYFALCLLQELHEAFLYSEEVKGKIPGDCTPPLSAAVLSCLRSLLTRQQPRLCHSLISFLQHSGHSRDHALQDVFIQHLTERVNVPVEERNEKWVEEVCSALALAPWGPERSNAQLETLWKGLWSAREGPMTEERILGCLLRPQDQALLTSYSSTAVRLLKEKLLREAPHTQGESIMLTVIIQTTSYRITFCFYNNLSFSSMNIVAKY